jgi:CheY-like chemotaxis protein
MTLRTPVHHRALRDGLARALAPRDDGGDATGRAPVPSPTRVPLHLRVLVVDDNRTSQKVAALMLRALGCDADIVADGPTAIAASDSGVYDAILMDCSMPAMDGPTATREIRRRGSGRPHTPIIAVTASAAKTDRDRCFEAGMDDYLTKPITIEALRAALVHTAHGIPALQARRAHPGTPPADGPVYSESTEVAGFVGTADPPAEVARLFLSEAPLQLEDVREAIARGDHSALAWAAHRLKGAVANFEGSSALDAVRHLGAMAESGGNSAGTDATWAAREQQLERLTVALTELLEEVRAVDVKILARRRAIPP